MTDVPNLRLKWQKTWPDKENDFSGRTSDSRTGSAGRIYAMKLYDPPRFWWAWYANGCIKGTDMWVVRNGHEETARAAAAKVEEVWFAALERQKAEDASGRSE